MDTHLRALVDDVIEQGQRLKDNWNCWDIQTRHDATNELHARWQDADNALMDAVRLTDFSADAPTQAPEQPAEAPADAETTPGAPETSTPVLQPASAS